MIAINTIKGRGLNESDFPKYTLANVYEPIVHLRQFRTESGLWGQRVEWKPEWPIQVGDLHGADLQEWSRDAPDVDYILWVDDTPLAWVLERAWQMHTYTTREHYGAHHQRFLGFSNYLPIPF